MNIATRSGLQAQNNRIISSVPDQKAFHDQIASEWELKYKKPSFQTRQAAFNECLPSVIKGQWLDGGCGTGYFGRWLAQLGAEVHFADNSPEMISVATQLLQNAPSDHRLHTPQLANVESLPFSDCQLDGILCSSVLEYVEDPAAVLAEFRRILRPEGWLVASVPNRDSIVRRALETIHGISAVGSRPWPEYLNWSQHRYTKWEFENLLRDTGFLPRRFAGCGASVPALKSTRFGWSLLVFGAMRLA